VPTGAIAAARAKDGHHIAGTAARVALAHGAQAERAAPRRTAWPSDHLAASARPPPITTAAKPAVRPEARAATTVDGGALPNAGSR
jgi:hypothetical protein